MKKTLINLFLFTAGATIGSLVTWKVVKTKYERIIQEEIDSFKETYALCMGGRSGNDGPIESSDNEFQEEELGQNGFPKSVMTDYAALAGKYGHPSNDEDENIEEGGGDDKFPYINGPVVITPEQYGDGNYDHDLYVLTYYDDGILANDWWETLDVEETIGTDALEHFGDYTEDVVHVRNERLKADYEVTKDPRNYADMIANDPLRRAYAD